MATDPALAPWLGCRRFSGAARQRGSWGTRGEEAGPVAGLGACTPSPRCLARGTSTRENDGGRLERVPVQRSLGTRRQRRFEELAGRRVPSIDGSGRRHCLVGRSGRLEPRPQQWPRATRLGGKGLDRVARATSTPRGECPSVVQLSGGGEPLFSRLLTRPAFPFGPGAAEVVTAAAPTVDRAHSHRHRHLGMPEAGFRGLDRAQRRPRAVGLETPEFQKQRGEQTWSVPLPRRECDPRCSLLRAVRHTCPLPLPASRASCGHCPRAAVALALRTPPGSRRRPVSQLPRAAALPPAHLAQGPHAHQPPIADRPCRPPGQPGALSGVRGEA